MSAQLSIDFAALQEPRELGMERATARANTDDSEWSGQAMGMMVAYANEVGRPFFTEEARPWAYAHGLQPPANEKAWGSIPRRARAKGLLRQYDHAIAPGNSCAKPRWIAANVPAGRATKE